MLTYNQIKSLFIPFQYIYKVWLKSLSLDKLCVEEKLYINLFLAVLVELK